MEQKYVKEAFDTNWVVPLGPNVNGFEKDLEEFVNGSWFTIHDYFQPIWHTRRRNIKRE